MPPRGGRLVCSLRSIDGCLGAYSAFPGETPKSIASVEEVKWDKPPEKEVQQATFSIIGDMGMTGQVLLVNQYQWRALTDAKMESFFYAAILWGGNPHKVIDDATLMAKRTAS